MSGKTERASGGEIVVRRMDPSDGQQVLALLRVALGWRREDPNDAFFDWKHRENPFGESPCWVASVGPEIVGFRTLMRWEFDTPDGPVRAVRAVDTATHPNYQGRGIFSALTRQAVEELTAEGVDFVFNTPNDKSRPGYLKMGWKDVGRLPTGLRPASLFALPRIAAARVPAELWSETTKAGFAVSEALGDDNGIAGLLAALPKSSGVTTRRTPAYLRWRYGFEPLAYRVVFAGTSIADGMLLFRLRRRGRATELVVGDLLLSEPTPAAARRLVRSALRATSAAYALGLRTMTSSGLLPLPGQGPILTWRSLGSETMPPLADWRLSLGDIELF
ncbi:MAG TPA: GNAT family N-acetyltransferase [Jiangellaceae bacterium]|nr:GNAT family N-acetyltransferase [Jiangellaceae bacterium]